MLNNERNEMQNGLLGTHIATGIPMEIPLNYKEMQLALHEWSWKWDTMCEMVLERTGITIIGEMEIDYMVVEGTKHVFH
tara:strand:+ start:123 stop:359 length:237 start_codon:yes stop_codon:yes gene_type:complete